MRRTSTSIPAETIYDVTPIDGIVAPAGLVGGYGDDFYNIDDYGTERSIPGSVAITKVPDAYSLGNFGSILYAMTSADSRLLMWDPGAGDPSSDIALATTADFDTTSDTIAMVANPGTVVPGMGVYDASNQLIGVVSTYDGASLVLTNNATAAGSSGDTLSFGNIAMEQQASGAAGPVPKGRCFVVTQERFIMVFGSTQDGTAGGGSSRRFAWCDQENPGAWDYSNVTSQAGFLDIEPASPIIAAIETRSGVVIWTATKAYSSRLPEPPLHLQFLRTQPTPARRGRRSRWRPRRV